VAVKIAVASAFVTEAIWVAETIFPATGSGVAPPPLQPCKEKPTAANTSKVILFKLHPLMVIVPPIQSLTTAVFAINEQNITGLQRKADQHRQRITENWGD